MTGNGPGTGEELTVRIESLAAGGDGVARDATGRVTFIPHTAPGDLVRVRTTDVRRSFARGRLLEVVEAGPGRIAASCPHFVDGRCGGCQWLHLDRDTQLAGKEALVTDALRAVIGAGARVEPMARPVPVTAWRRRARLHWIRRRGTARALIGFRAPRSHRIVDVEHCEQLEPPLAGALGLVREHLAAALSKRGEIEIVAGVSGEVLIAVHGPVAARALAALAEADGVAGVSSGRRLLGATEIEVDQGVVIGAGQFAQPSRAGNDALVELVARVAEPRAGARILELFAGSGNFTRVLAPGAARVVAVDADAARGRYQADNVSWRRVPAEDAVARLVRAGERFDLAVLDPPRAGARASVTGLAELGFPRFVYVSCEPATLARDLEILMTSGYRVECVQPLDLMPQTSHVEVVAWGGAASAASR